MVQMACYFPVNWLNYHDGLGPISFFGWPFFSLSEVDKKRFPRKVTQQVYDFVSRGLTFRGKNE